MSKLKSIRVDRCEDTVYRKSSAWGGSYVRCRNKTKVEYEGKHYCGVHDPNRRNARWEAYDRKREAESRLRELETEKNLAHTALAREARELTRRLHDSGMRAPLLDQTIARLDKIDGIEKEISDCNAIVRGE